MKQITLFMVLFTCPSLVFAQSADPFSGDTTPQRIQRSGQDVRARKERLSQSGQVVIEGAKDAGPFLFRIHAYVDEFGKRHVVDWQRLIGSGERIGLITNGKPLVAQKVYFTISTREGSVDLVGAYEVQDGDKLILNITRNLVPKANINPNPVRKAQSLSNPASVIHSSPRWRWPDLEKPGLDPLEREARKASHALFESKFTLRNDSVFGVFFWDEDPKQNRLHEMKKIHTTADLSLGTDLNQADRQNGIECKGKIRYFAETVRMFPDATHEPYSATKQYRHEWSRWAPAGYRFFEVDVEKLKGQPAKVIGFGPRGERAGAEAYVPLRKPDPQEIPQ